MIRIVLPAHLRTLAGVEREVRVEMEGRVTQRSVLDALEARYPTCGVKACANDQFLEIDHIVPLERHGRTEIDNLWRLCSHHHRLKTYAGWKVIGHNGDRNLAPPDDPDPP